MLSTKPLRRESAVEKHWVTNFTNTINWVLVNSEKGLGLNGKFTDHLGTAGMWNNCSLNTTADKERYHNKSKDWMDHLGWISK